MLHNLYKVSAVILEQISTKSNTPMLTLNRYTGRQVELEKNSSKTLHRGITPLIICFDFKFKNYFNYYFLSLLSVKVASLKNTLKPKLLFYVSSALHFFFYKQFNFLTRPKIL